MFITIQTRDGKNGLTHTDIFHPFSDIQIFWSQVSYNWIPQRTHAASKHLSQCFLYQYQRKQPGHQAEISSFDISKEKLILAPNLHSTHINKAQEGRAMWPNSFPSPAESCEPLHLRHVSEGSLCATQSTAEQNRRPHAAPAHTLWKYNTPHFLILYITKTSPTSNLVTNSTAFHLTSGSNIFMEMKSKLIARNFFPPF